MKSMRSVAVTFIAAIMLLGMVPAGAQGRHEDVRRTRPTEHGSVRRAHHEPNYAWQLFRATNASRHRHGLRALARNRDASNAAARHSIRMARANRLFHSSTMGPYLDGVGRWTSWGENIGWTSADVASLERAFMASAVHRSHILSRAFRHVAVGAVMYRHKLWVTLVFYG